MTKRFMVTLPMAGHVYVEVEADDAESAITRALETQLGQEHLKDAEWEVLAEVNRGNVCYCPTPWQAYAEEQED